ncbi:hypothetical protein PGB90_007338 [Kerria lacca]
MFSDYLRYQNMYDEDYEHFANPVHTITRMPSSHNGFFKCPKCGNCYARHHSLSRHIRFECGVDPQFECPICHKKSKHKHNLLLHMRTHR